MAWTQRLAGKFIVFDGPDGSGKSTQFARFAAWCRERGVSVCEVREPGGTSIGEQIRTILLDPKNTEISLRCEMMLYMASRSQLVEQVIRPALARRDLVLADRFISSTLAYQGTAGGMSREEIMAVGNVAVDDCRPDLTVIFDVPPEVADGRVGPQKDRMEQKDRAYHARVREGYLQQARQETMGKYLMIDAGGDADAVFAKVIQGLEKAVG